MENAFVNKKVVKRAFNGKRLTKKILLNVALIGLAIFTVFPLFTVIVTAFKTNDQIVNNPYGFIPSPFSGQAYREVFQRFPFFKYLGNSLIICIANVIGVPLTSTMAGYAFSKFNVRHKKYIFLAMMAMIMVPGTVLQIPTFEMYVGFGWINKYYPFIIPAFLGGGISNVFLVRQFVSTIPRSLFESAEIDGASEPVQFIKIALPLSMPIIMTIAVFTFTGCWNDFFSPLLYLTDENLYTLGYGLFIFFSQCKIGTQRAWNIICAASMLVMIPSFLIFAFAQKYFVEGITITGIKG
ncbi:MAG: carbohydrate ABC transporter permease [Clostridia bacterium]|nr:carbohydrate ABC transporter permease [Clostridia bacterium]